MNESGLEMRAPQLLNLSVKSVSSFVEARRAYDLAVQDKNATVPAARRIIPISLKASMQPSLLHMICDMEMEVDFDDLTEEDLWDYLTQKCSHQLKMSEAPMKSIFAEISLNMSIKDANSRIIDLWRQWYEVKEKYQVAADFATDKGKKLLRQSMVSKLWPANVKTRVFNKLRDVDAEAERIRNSDKEFFDYVVRIASEQERSFSFNGSGNKRPFEDYVDSDDECRPH